MGLPVVALVLVLIAVAVGLAGILQALREHRKPRELRGDWWAQFEREFRAYATKAPPSGAADHPNQAPGSRHERRHHRGEAA